MTQCETGVLKAIIAKQISDDRKKDLLIAQFGDVGSIVISNRVYTIMRGLAADYKTSEWKYHQLSNGGFYLEPAISGDLHIEYKKAGFSSSVSPMAAGVIASLHAYSSLGDNGIFGSDMWSKNYKLLLDYVNFLPEKNNIWRSID